jgi:hypothetical protein
MSEPNWIDITSMTDGGYRIEMDAMSKPARYRHCRLSGSGQSEWIAGLPVQLTDAPPMTRAELALRDGTAANIAHELLAECERQVAEEGYTPKHDERHPFRDFAAATAAAAYAWSAYVRAFNASNPREQFSTVGAGLHWTWDMASFKPKDERRDLVRAGALIIKAIERHDREIVRDADGLADG